MTSQAYYDWRNAGSPYGLCRPGFELGSLFQRAGYTVYHYPDEAHLKADPPQDHTPFSATGWPLPSKRWIGHAIDIMPKADLMPLSDLALHIVAAKQRNENGTQPIKYVNWTDRNGDCWHTSWQPDRRDTTSTDKGHIHISFRSDMDDSDIISRSGWNPITGGTMTVVDSFGPTALTQLHNVVYNGDAGPEPGVQAAWIKWDAAAKYSADNSAKLDALASKVDALPLTGEAFAGAIIAALTARPEVVDALAIAVASRIGMIPTAQEIAKAVGELNWHGRVES